MPTAPDATGRLWAALPADMPEDERLELLGLVRLGVKFSQHKGRPPGVLALHVRDTVKRTRPASFDALLTDLELDALRHQLRGEGCIVKVDRAFECVRYIEHGEERECTFKRVANIASLRKSRKAISRETGA